MHIKEQYDFHRKMWLQFIPLLVFTFTVVTMEESDEQHFDVVSTSQRPSENEHINDRLCRIEKQLELQSQLTENRRLLETLEHQNKRIEETLIKTSSTLMHLTNLQTKITEDLQRLEQKIEKRLETNNQTLLDVSQSSKGFPRNCKEVQDRGSNVSNVYRIQPDASEPFYVFCNMEVRGGGWTYVLNRFDGSQDFYLNWTDYKDGFGNLLKEFWLGLEHLYKLTENELNELLIELVDWDLKKVHAHYSMFIIGSESEGYHLKSLGNYRGDAGDSFGSHAGLKFSTKDKDQDGASGNCATTHAAAWWYDNCFDVHLTGRYLKGENAGNFGTCWRSFHDIHYSLKEVRMMVKPKGV